jgi:thiol-disulfide isomerase/thioredoxin
MTLTVLAPASSTAASANATRSQNSTPAPTASVILERAVAAYSRLPEIYGRMAYEIEFPDGRREQKELRYGRRGSDLFVALVLPDGQRLMEVVASGSHLFASQANVPNAYLDSGYDGDFSAAAHKVGMEQVGLKLPPPIAAAIGGASGGTSALLDALGFGILGPLAPTAVRTVATGGEAAFEVELTASTGTCLAVFDAETHRLQSFVLTVGEPGHQVRGRGRFEPLPLEELDRELAFDPAGRTPVADFAELDASAYPLGEPAPDAVLPSLDGQTVTLAELRGSVVVLDFWATWCVPCWKALPEIEKLAGWARQSGEKVVVYAVSTQETPDLAAQRAKVQKFLTGRSLAVPTLLDADGSFFAAMSSPGLPSTVVIAPDGTLAQYHSGLVPDMFEALRGEVEALLP